MSRPIQVEQDDDPFAFGHAGEPADLVGEGAAQETHRLSGLKRWFVFDAHHARFVLVGRGSPRRFRRGTAAGASPRQTMCDTPDGRADRPPAAGLGIEAYEQIARGTAARRRFRPCGRGCAVWHGRADRPRSPGASGASAPSFRLGRGVWTTYQAIMTAFPRPAQPGGARCSTGPAPGPDPPPYARWRNRTPPAGTACR